MLMEPVVHVNKNVVEVFMEQGFAVSERDGGV